MPATHKKYGDIALPVGSYEKAGKTKQRSRKIGELWQTTHDTGESHLWIRVNSEVLQTSLLLLNRSVAAKKGDDTTLLNVFTEREEGAKTAESAPADDIPF